MHSSDFITKCVYNQEHLIVFNIEITIVAQII